MTRKKTAILYFTRTSALEARRKQWHASYQVNLRVAQEFIATTRRVLLDTGIDVIEINETLQEGTTFGARIRHAFAHGFSLGYDSLMLVGNDTLGLEVETLLEAQDVLEAHSYVAGSTKKGGVYVLGMDRHAFETCSKPLENLPWKSSQLFDAMADLFAVPNGSSLPILDDVNTGFELLKHLRKNRDSAFTQRLHRALHGMNARCSSLLSPFYSFLAPQNALTHRGPPVFA